jgi:tetratricopeptide (TPR) repeat protein
VRSDDSPAVRAVLRDYDRQSDNTRLGRVQKLAQLDEGEGVAGLCRIARFDRSPIVSRTAALAIIRPDERRAAPVPVDPLVVERELGASTRVSATWLRRYLAQLSDPAASAAPWEELIDEETARLKQFADDTSAEIVTALLWNLAEVYRQKGDIQAIVGVVERMIGVDPDAVDQTAIALMTWIMEHESWDVLDEFLDGHQTQLERSKRPLYYAALARAEQGKGELAEQLAEKAAQLDPQTALESFVTAKDLEEHRQFDWAVREYRRAIDSQKIASHEGILARIYLGSLLHDYEHHGEAADVLEPLANAVKNERQVGQLYADLQRYYEDRIGLPKVDAVSARLHYYRACQYHKSEDWQRERDELKLANRFDPTDPDVLIAMHRVPESDEKWRKAVQQQILNLCRQIQKEIDDNPNDPDAYNQWAWLVSNTEGDFQQAIRYSHRSIELIPSGAGESAGASFLDTLGRCYYAAGDYENALKYQRQAIKKVDYMQVMHRQLALFEKTLAEKRGASSKEQGAGESD